jgi:alkyldihydroxyacetonephosphate synthase
MQPHVGFPGHSVSQLQAPLPPTFSSQYQPAGQIPLPHRLQVPSSQLRPFDFSDAERLSFGSSSSLLAELSPGSSALLRSPAADLTSPLVAPLPPHSGSSKSRAKQQSKARILRSVYVPWLWGYKGLVDLADVVREQLPGLSSSARALDRAAAARDAWPRHLIAEASAPQSRPEPALVVWPVHTEQVEAVVALARREGISLVPYGAGSGVCGAVRPSAKSIVVDMKRLTKVSVLPEQGVVDVEAGVLGVDLEAALERNGLTVGHFPSSILCSTVGGWLAARGAGQCSSRYGKIEDMVKSADCVLGTGDSVRFTRRSAGPNPLDLLIGSEGTLGLITSSRLRLHAAPKARAFAAFELPSFEQGAEAMRVVMQAGLRPAVMRLYDPIDSYLLGRGKVADERGREPKAAGVPSGFWLRAALSAPRALNGAIVAFERFVSGSATLILIFEGDTEEARGELLRAERALSALSGRSLGQAPARAWLAHRYAVSYRQSKVFQQGAFNDTLEVAAPWARLSHVYAAVREAAGAHALVLAHLSHAYPDGCSIYFTLVATRAGDALSRYDALLDAALGAALAEGATLSHHHGVGTSKAHWLDAELGGGMSTLQRLRRAWDPERLLNPSTFEPLREPPHAVLREAVPGVDAVSGVATFHGDTALLEIEAEARNKGLTLGLVGDVPELTLRGFIDAGLPGLPDPFADPVRGSVCGIQARGPVAKFRLLTAPRRATGPNLAALCVGAGGEIARVESASLALVRRDAEARGSTAAAPVALAVGEAAAWGRVVDAFRTA